MKQKIGDVAIELMKREGVRYIGYNEFGLLDDVFSLAENRGIVKPAGSRGGRFQEHPVNNQIVVLNALGKDERFKKFLIRCCSRNGRSERLVREFKLNGKRATRRVR